MNQKQLIFDYQAGTIRRDFLNEGPKEIVKNTQPKATAGLIETVWNFVTRK